VLINLITNALKFTLKGFIKVKVSVQNESHEDKIVNTNISNIFDLPL